MPLDTEKSNSIKADEIEKLSDDIMNNNLPGEVLLICVCYKPDKRGRFYKWFDKKADSLTDKGVTWYLKGNGSPKTQYRYRIRERINK